MLEPWERIIFCKFQVANMITMKIDTALFLATLLLLNTFFKTGFLLLNWTLNKFQ